jgi:phospholipid/cholesterol/gamma-HCH transport system substrate-binding protein
VDSVLSNLNSVFASSSTKGIPDMFKSLQNTLTNLESSSSSLDELLTTNNQRITDIFANVESISGNLKKNNENLTTAMTNFASLSDTLARLQLASTVLKVDKALGGFSEVITKINEGSGTLGQLVTNDSLHHELVSASHSLDLLLDDMRVHPKRYVQVSLIGRRDTERFSKAQLEQMRKEINTLLREREKEKSNEDTICFVPIRSITGDRAACMPARNKKIHGTLCHHLNNCTYPDLFSPGCPASG